MFWRFKNIASLSAIVLACLLVCAILFHMIPTWGTLAKAQDDPTTIDEAIAAAILAHDNASSSHLSSGASLANHKSNDVLDHPLGSVLADKKTQTEYFFQTQFENLAAFATHGSPSPTFPGFRLIPTSTAFANRKEVGIDPSSTNLILDFSKDFLFQFSLIADTYSGGSFLAQIGFSLGSQTENGVGLEIINGVAKFYVAKEDGSSKSYLAWPSYTDLNEYVVRAQYVASEGKVHFYINGEELGALVYPDTSASDPLGVDFWYYRTSGTSHEVDVLDMTLSLSLV